MSIEWKLIGVRIAEGNVVKLIGEATVPASDLADKLGLGLHETMQEKKLPKKLPKRLKPSKPRKPRAPKPAPEEEEEEETIDEDEEGTIFDEAAKEKLKENKARLNNLQKKVQAELKSALPFNAQKVLAAMKKGAVKRKEIWKESGVPYSEITGALKALIGKKLVKKTGFGIYELTQGAPA